MRRYRSTRAFGLDTERRTPLLPVVEHGYAKKVDLDYESLPRPLKRVTFRTSPITHRTLISRFGPSESLSLRLRPRA